MKPNVLKHGVVRGLENVPSSALFEGKFGRMFRTLPPANFSIEDLKKLANVMAAEPEEVEAEAEADAEIQGDPEENSGISAGFTYLGQFIDHDLTFDPSSLSQKQIDPDALTDFRTPRFDLDNVYGRGPDDQPYMYDEDGLKFVLGKKITNPNDPNARDLPRAMPDSGARRAVIGDPRNDENVIVSQLHAIFLRFHNSMVDYYKSKNFDASFEAVQRQVRWHYQWIVLNEFLPTIIGQDVVNEILPHIKNNTDIKKDPPLLKFYHWKNSPYIPIEFSVAAYRFGHSMVRPEYRLNTAMEERLPIFPDLVGFGEFDPSFGIDWRLFFDFGNNPNQRSTERIQPAYKIDTSLVNPLKNLPANIVSQNVPSLAERNLRRGLMMRLPSGQSVARKMGIEVIPDQKLKVGKATSEDSRNNKPITEISRSFADNAPLWFYILAEAQQQYDGNDQTPIKLGPVGGRIVGEVFAGMLVGDKLSFLNQKPDFKPHQDFTRNGKFGMAELITQAQKA